MTSSQTIEKHRWENRILLVISEENNSNEEYSNQLQVINDSLEGYTERKLIVYTVLPNKYRLLGITTNQEANWIKNSKLYSTYNENKKPFKVVLIGLDGGVKEERNAAISSEELFAIIDGMPMRRSELNRK
ncbi:hypothetical protein DDD_1844 [Nonlabens dokdonensis DSW-6]|jgi:hypothetical protein|uniref:DUF4174 domain-containing protein n=2 Tax=Nonlabens dokdonensis TaxID=328515 RepID=L7WAS2_NONDD|nr:hypothetical protein DDD_1844 [Nonlabens dokdonensis DSW-6]